MKDSEWTKFFDLVRKIINQPDMTAGEKTEALKNKAEENDEDDFALGELSAMLENIY